MQPSEAHSKDFLIRVATVDDIPLLMKLGVETYRETFIEDFGIQYPAEDEAQFIREAYSEAALRRYFEGSSYRHFLGERGGVALGYALVGRNSLPHPNARPQDGEFKRLYVKREAQALGLGWLLFQAGLNWLERYYPGPLWLGVWERNERAKAFYFRNGFEQVGQYTFRVGQTEELDWILRKAP